MTPNLPEIFTGINLSGLFGQAHNNKIIPWEIITAFPNGNLLLPRAWKDSLCLHLYDPHMKMRTCLQASNRHGSETRSFSIAQHKGAINLGSGSYNDQEMQNFRFETSKDTNKLSFLPIQSRVDGNSHFAIWSSDTQKTTGEFTGTPDGIIFEIVKEFYRESVHNILKGRMPDFADIQSIVTFPFTTLASMSDPAHSIIDPEEPKPKV